VTAQHCLRCGDRLPGAPPVSCTSCGYEMFVNPRPTASIVVADGERFLALLRAHEPNVGRWDLPGGFCDGFEHPEAAAVREAREELGVDIRLDAYIGMYLGTYLFQDEVLPTLDCFWLATIVGGHIVLDPSEASALRWIPFDNPPPMAFPTQDAALRDLAVIRTSVRLPG